MESVTVLEASIILLVTDIFIIFAGVLVFKKWTDDGETPPVYFILGTWLVSFILYGFVTRFLFMTKFESNQTLTRFLLNTKFDANDTLPILLYCVFFWSFPVVYYGRVLVTALSAHRVANYSWLSIQLPKGDDLPVLGEFSEAQTLAAQGDIDQAIEVYSSYMAHRPRAIMAAAALLESHNRYEEAVRLLHELLEQGVESTTDWARATLQLANLNESHLRNDDEAITLYNQIILRAPDSTEGQLASSSLARLRPDGDSLLDMLDAGFDTPSAPRSEAPPQRENS